MELAISNIAWEPGEDNAIRQVLTAAGVRAIEVAPTKIWPDPSSVPPEEASRYREAWESCGFRLVAMQSLLYGRPALTIFDDHEHRAATHDYLVKIIELAAHLGVRPLVFGSPKNRLIRSMPRSDAMRIATDFFRRIGDVAAGHGVELCIEPNPPQYGCDFIRTVAEGVELVRTVDSPGFRLHLDGSALILNGEDIGSALDMGFGCMSHFHISEPYLALPGSYEGPHQCMAQGLQRLGYSRYVSIEMLSGRLPENAAAVSAAVEFAKRVYEKQPVSG